MRHFFFVPLVMTALSGCAVKAPVSEMTAIAPLAAPALSVESAEGGRDFIAQIADFSALEGWREDSHDVALKAFADVCGKILARDPDAAMGGASFGLTPLAGYAEDWRGPCQAAAVRPGQERAFFEQWFLPVRIASSTTDPALYTGYFEPELEGSLTPSDVYRYPIYRTPANLERAPATFSRAAIDAGFTSIMFDGSALPLADNIRATTAAVRLAKDNGLSCEGELGFVGYAEGTPGVGTIPSEAALFEAETGIDALAVSVGNVHLQREQAAVIDHDRLAEIGAVTRCPLVIHGGSGLTNADRALLAHRSPVCKFNIGTELRQVFGKALRQRLSDDPALFDRIAILSAVEGPLVAATKEILRGIGPIGPK